MWLTHKTQTLCLKVKIKNSIVRFANKRLGTGISNLKSRHQVHLFKEILKACISKLGSLGFGHRDQ